MQVTLKRVVNSDSIIIFTWRNEASTVSWMGAARELSFEEHQRWFNSVVDDPNYLLFIIAFDTIPVGHLRYQKHADNAAKVSINITHSMHGKGIASQAFKKGSEFVRGCDFAEDIFAYVQATNIGSIKALEKAGFRRGAFKSVHAIEHIVMTDTYTACY